MEGNFLTLNDISSYRISFNLSNYVWQVVARRDYLAKDTVGKQYIRAVDSVSANIAEGFGRRTKKDKINFYRYGYGSVKECSDWNEKSKARKLLTVKQYDYVFAQFQLLPREINGLIKFTNERIK
jgi:four helix bundle protein